MRRLLLALLACLILAPSAHAAGFTETLDLAPPGIGADYTVQAMGPEGDAAILWTDLNIEGNPVFAATRAPGEAFGPGVRISGDTGGSTQTDAAIDAAGNLIVVYVLEGDGLDPTLYARVRPRGGTFSEPVALSEPLRNPFRPRIEMNAAGKAVVSWVDNAPDIARAVVREPGGSFPAPADAEALAPVLSVVTDAAIDAAGTAYVSLRHNDESELPFALYRMYPGETDFSGPEPISGPGEQELNANLEVNDAGHVLFAYTASNAAWAAYAPPESSLGTAQNLGTITNTSAPEVALDAAGNALISWENADRAVLVRRPAGQLAGPIEPMGGTDSFHHDIATTPDGSFAILLFEEDDAESFSRVHARLGSVTGEFAPAEILSPAGTNIEYPRVDMQANGDSLLGWYRYNLDEQIPQWRAYDRNPPRFPGLSIPATGVAGSPVAFTAGAIDTWSPFSVQWSFGDGAVSPDANTSHTYTVPGTYDVTVGAADALANGTSTGGQIVITEPVVQPPATTIPVLSSLSLKPRRFRAFRRGGPIVGTTAAKRGTTVRYSLDVAARVIFRVQRKRGRKWRRVKGRFGVDSTAGANQFRYSGRLRKRALRPGRYRMVAKPRNGAGKGAVTRARFRVVRR